jgi:hypothetical protein
VSATAAGVVTDWKFSFCGAPFCCFVFAFVVAAVGFLVLALLKAGVAVVSAASFVSTASFVSAASFEKFFHNNVLDCGSLW